MPQTQKKIHQNQDISKSTVSKRDEGLFDKEQYNPVKGEMALWTAVITQALMDAGSESRKPEAQHEKAKAIRWLLGNSEDFVTVCQNAGKDPQVIREKAMAAIERGCVWRRGMHEKRQHASSPPHPATLEKKYYIPSRPAQLPLERPRMVKVERRSVPRPSLYPLEHVILPTNYHH